MQKKLNLNRKIKKLGALKKIIRALKKQNKRVVFTNGCFDLLHFGHVKYLEDAKAKGDILVVAVNSDSSVKKIKDDNRPVIGEVDRIKTVAALESVDYVLLFSESTPLKAIKSIRPDMLVKGADWKIENVVGGEFVVKNGGKVAAIKLVNGRSTTNLINKIVKLFCGKGD